MHAQVKLDVASHITLNTYGRSMAGPDHATAQVRVGIGTI